MEDGLPSRLVYDAIQDKDGFMWFATANGLCRYDGNNFKTYNIILISLKYFNLIYNY
jgi:ligand-binding sensor domain-containing protein